MNMTLWREKRIILYDSRKPIDPDDSLSDFHPPLTPEQMVRLVVLTKQGMLEDGFGYYADKEMTCSRCLSAPTCALAFDSYNFDGDCIMEK